MQFLSSHKRTNKKSNLFNLNKTVIAFNRRRKPYRGRVKKQNPHRINEEILSFNIRLVGDNTENNISNTKKALAYAKNLGLDLVEISPKADPPVYARLSIKNVLI